MRGEVLLPSAHFSLPPSTHTQAEPWRLASLLLVVLLGAAAHDLDLISIDRLAAVVELESDVADQEGPDFVAEAVGVEGALRSERRAESALLFSSPVLPCYFHSVPYPRKHPDAAPRSRCRWKLITLNVNLALTFSCNVSAITRSNWVRTFMASWGSMRSSPISSSRASVRAMPRLRGATRECVSQQPQCSFIQDHRPQRCARADPHIHRKWQIYLPWR